ncbi:hypothetical protein SAMN02745151_02935 [[Clostridium] propionicum DSM 1682]|jgi:hypothetical protein|uniref:Uncharacterized protein n=1 Tax=Anaerotignum propionicum DSM 1682 TaxID=991789 RepID=A0A0X8VDJ0_ANAPI|nr:hypothetical protein CPRO_24610 [Anaerotignum propionicum DSM 1682]SHF14961.1 hypothetical protein SAMN02745151_02935 [[Clostridium] propionicum DSM 1682] [Anaerotignum propionicum DSM 1682]
MYPYHNKIKQRIKNGELETYYFCESYPKIGECLVLVFVTEPVTRPIRPHRYHEYLKLLEQQNKENSNEVNQRGK